jgi:hypothetical protein
MAGVWRAAEEHQRRPRRSARHRVGKLRGWRLLAFRRFFFFFFFFFFFAAGEYRIIGENVVASNGIEA